jgi:hypothetical protein
MIKPERETLHGLNKKAPEKGYRKILVVVPKK